ncbi:hypothetical protein RRG08_060519 [Elysia crispata]|uniref:FAS1 domain-containing protein n=1 Tax=Elysia crispata TaxID=231223 RepID=A0AAE1ACE3_9GAST|nr:hypothetical protein RRG08_060519 [Elysia crispata]
MPSLLGQLTTSPFSPRLMPPLPECRQISSLPLRAHTTELQKVLGYHVLLEDVKGLHKNGTGLLLDKVVMSSNGLPININVYRSINIRACSGSWYLHNADKSITVFAPYDAAFAKLSPGVVEYLLSHPQELKIVLRYHLVKQKTRYSISFRHTISFHSADRPHDRLMVFQDFATGDMKINTARIVQKDISAKNGVIHIKDEVLIPARVLLKIEGQGITIG